MVAASVVMPVHNARAYLDQSVASILGQTHTDFELVILENGSTDGSREALRRWAETDRRIRLVEEPQRLGLVESSNRVARLARAHVIARMDADDVSHPTRLARQLTVLENDAAVVLVGTLYRGIAADGRPVRPFDRSPLLRRMTESPFPHGSTMFRRSAFDEVGGYGTWEGWEDLDLLHRLAEVGRVLVLPEPLYDVRFHRSSSTASPSVPRAQRREEAKDRVVAARFPDGTAPRRSNDDRMLAVLYRLAALRLWSGERPSLLRQLLARRLIRPAPRNLAVLVWASWARVAPSSLRRAAALWIVARDRLARHRLAHDEPFEWRFG
jgi:glycosyltransferase involved in cell wall biosynthesis